MVTSRGLGQGVGNVPCAIALLVAVCLTGCDRRAQEKSEPSAAAAAATPSIPEKMRGTWNRKDGKGSITVSAMGISGQLQTVHIVGGIQRDALAIEAGRVDGQSYIVDKAMVTGDMVLLRGECKGSLDLVSDSLSVSLAGEGACSEVLSGAFTREPLAAADATKVPAPAAAALAGLKGRIAIKVRKWGSCTATERPDWNGTKGWATITPSNPSNTAGSIYFAPPDGQTANYTFTEFSGAGADWIFTKANGEKVSSNRVRFADNVVQIDDFWGGCASISLVSAAD